MSLLNGMKRLNILKYKYTKLNTLKLLKDVSISKIQSTFAGRSEVAVF